MKKRPTAEKQIAHNKAIHDAVASAYEKIHNEIYNPTEQARVASILEWAISQIQSQPENPSVLDFGAGTGNLTRHLLDLGARVLAADVSRKSLDSLESAFGGTGRIDTVELGGVDLSNLDDNSLDMVATYSVLHHVPDYLTIVSEFVRVVKPGGVIYIDHEIAPSHWNEDPNPSYAAYQEELRVAYSRPLVKRLAHKFMCLFSLTAWKRLIYREVYGLSQEGDIHILEDDHIEWDRIEEILQGNCTMLKSEDYLVCRELSPDPPLHKKYRDECVDMRAVVCVRN